MDKSATALSLETIFPTYTRSVEDIEAQMEKIPKEKPTNATPATAKKASDKEKRVNEGKANLAAVHQTEIVNHGQFIVNSRPRSSIMSVVSNHQPTTLQGRDLNREISELAIQLSKPMLEEDDASLTSLEDVSTAFKAATGEKKSREFWTSLLVRLCRSEGTSLTNQNTINLSCCQCTSVV